MMDYRLRLFLANNGRATTTANNGLTKTTI
jgi:hypothetical protein